jgi:hypothetical protein
VAVADLGDRGHVDDVIQSPVPAPGQPVDLPVPRRHLDRRGAVVSGEAVPAGEAGRVRDVADHGGGDDRADAEDLGERGARSPDHQRQLLPGVTHLRIEAAQVIEEFGGELAAGQGNGTGRLGLLQEMCGLTCGYLLGDAAGEEFAEHGAEPAGDLAACPGHGGAWTTA